MYFCFEQPILGASIKEGNGRVEYIDHLDIALTLAVLLPRALDYASPIIWINLSFSCCSF